MHNSPQENPPSLYIPESPERIIIMPVCREITMDLAFLELTECLSMDGGTTGCNHAFGALLIDRNPIIPLPEKAKNALQKLHESHNGLNILFSDTLNYGPS